MTMLASESKNSRCEMGFRAQFRAMLALLEREAKRFFRQRSRVIGALVTPLCFWLILGLGLGSSFQREGQSYLYFFLPGAVMMSVLFTAIFSTLTVIEDRHSGFLQSVLISPLNVSAILGAKVIGGALLGTVQGALILMVAPWVGYRFDVLFWAYALLVLFVSGLALTALGFVVAWVTDSVQGYHAMMNLLLFPLWLLSGAVFPVEGSHSLFQWIAAVNPVGHAMNLFRGILIQDFSFELAPDRHLFHWMYLGGFFVVVLVISIVQVRRSVRAVV